MEQYGEAPPIPIKRKPDEEPAGAVAERAAPRPAIGLTDAMALIVGIVIGAGIFKTPSLVAANGGSEGVVLLAWLLGGAVSLAGALCYAELATTYPNAGGEYSFLSRAYGRDLAFLFAWARLTVIPTGSVALMAFVFGDYASQLFRFGEHSSSIYAGLVVIVLTSLNIMGIRQGKRAQNLLTAVEALGVVIVICAGFALATPQTVAAAGGDTASAAATAPGSAAAWGMMMIFVLLTYGGWNDSAYISAEMRGERRTIARALILSIMTVTVLYLLINLAYIKGLGLQAMGQSEAVASDLMNIAMGESGAILISVLIAVAAVTSANATILMGARSNYALGRDFIIFSPLGRWNERAGAPINALLAQGAITLALVLLGTLQRKGFETMVDYTAPVFWFFFLLTGASIFVLRAREPQAARPFRVPLYPLTPILFCAASAYLLYSSLAYTGVGALVGIAVLGVGALVLLVARRK
jgi:amino acid transporter